MKTSDLYLEVMQRIGASPDPDNMTMSVDEAAAYTGMSKSQMAMQRSRNTGAFYIKIGKRVLYRKADLDAFLASKVVKTRDAVAA